MEINIQRLEENKIVKIEFPSKTKARKFIKTLTRRFWYTSFINLKDIPLDILLYDKQIAYNNCAWGVDVDDYTKYILVEPVKIPTRAKVGGAPSPTHTTHYLTKDIDNSDLALRFYIDFGNRPSYIGKWFVKCKKTKKYLEITEEQASRVSKEMCCTGFSRVIGFKESKGYRRIIVDDRGYIEATLNRNLQLGKITNRILVKEGKNGN